MVSFPGAGLATPGGGDTAPASTPRMASGYLASSASGPAPGILALHAWWGLNDTFRAVADRLAAEGFCALAPDIFGDGSVVTTVEEAQARIEALDEVGAEQAILGAIARLQAEPGVAGGPLGVIGFSMGAAFAMWVSARAPDVIRATVAVYGSGGSGSGRSAVQVHAAQDDAWQPEEETAEMEAELRTAGREVESFRYPGTRHWFLEPDRPEYDPDATALAWSRIVPFLRTRLTRA